MNLIARDPADVHSTERKAPAVTPGEVAPVRHVW
jgi:hypothetical protein